MSIRKGTKVNVDCEKCNEQIAGEWCVSCRKDFFKENFTNWTSENKRIDEFIQEVQLNISCDDIVFEWIPYNQFNNIKEVKKDNFVTLKLSIWNNGPLSYCNNKKEWTREPNKKVSLKCLCNTENNINEFLNEVKLYSTNIYEIENKIYGISQDPDTKDYLIVFENEYCWNCGEEYTDANVDWSKWKNGPLCYNADKKEWIRESERSVALKCLCNSQNIIDEFLNEVKTYSTCIYEEDNNLYIYGISQNPETKDYIMVLQDGFCKECGEKYIDKWCKSCHINYFKKDFVNWTSGNENIDDFIQDMQLKISKQSDTKFEWIPYDRFNNIEEISKNDLVTVHTAIWNDGPLHYNNNEKKWLRESNKDVALKCLYNSQSNINRLLNEVKDYFNNKIDNNDNNAVDGDDDVEMLTNIGDIDDDVNDDDVDIDEDIYVNDDIDDDDDDDDIGGGDDIDADDINDDDDIDVDDIDVDDISGGDVEDNVNINYRYDDDDTYSIKIYGISQNPYTKDYIIVLQDVYCKECGEEYADIEFEWCKLCSINYIKSNFTNWTSGNENIDNLIQEMQLRINDPLDLLFEWIPYDQFSNIKEIGRGGFATIYSAIWKDGPQYHDIYNTKEWIRDPGKNVALKCLRNSLNISPKFLNEIKAYSIANSSKILNVYGISQKPDTKDYIMVLDYASGGNFNDWMNRNYKKIEWGDKLSILFDICEGLEEIHQNQMVHHDFHTGNILFEFQDKNSLCISDMGLCGDVGEVENNTDETKVFGVIPYVAPEVLSGKPYTQAADIYSFGMIMYFVATGRQPFFDRAHNENLVLTIFCYGIRPELNEPEAPKCYIDLMKKCWDSNPSNRPKVNEILELINSFQNSYDQEHDMQEQQDYEKIIKSFSETEKYRKLNFSFEDSRPTHPKATYISRLLNPYTKKLPKHDNEIYEFSDNKIDELLKDGMILTEDESDFESTKRNIESSIFPESKKSKLGESEFSDNIAVEKFLLQNVSELD
ncbi:kinase-like domain-containing protein [Rhizophagus clarus]|uniref:Kinase-like domain-containing protein n=1 Tax=Rhizophagus clarus TaxID=94130 RepID=A0A8H3QBX7_9GLOM|nr:kinase-like domain-containing protein [Rhizophagus clarus]